MKLTKNCVKYLTKKIFPILFSLLLVFISAFTISIFSPARKVYASGVGEVIVNNIKNYLYSVSGVVQKTADGITHLPQTIDDEISQYVIDNLNGDGIYVDGDGNYVFSNNFMKEFYKKLSSNSSLDCYVCADFSRFNDQITSQYTNSQYNNDVLGMISEAKTLATTGTDGSYLLCCALYHDSSNYIVQMYAVVLNDNFGYFAVDNINGKNTWFTTYNVNGGIINNKFARAFCSYSLQNRSYYNSTTSFSENRTTNTLPAGMGSFGSALYNNGEVLYNGFPNYNSTTNGSGYTLDACTVYCSDPLIIAKSKNDGSTYMSVTNNYTDYFVVNHNSITISQNAIQNNNWTNIYNKYVTNVNNEYKNTSGLTKKQVQKIMKKYTDSLLKSIQDGVEDLEEKIEDVSEWLEKISSQIDEINSYLEAISNNLDNGVGGDGCAWTEEDVTRVKQILERFYLYSDDYLDRLQDIDVNTDNLETDVLAVKDAILALKSSLETWKQKIDYLPGISETVSATDIKVGSMQSTLVTISTALETIINKINGLGKKVSVPDVDPDIIDDISDLADDKLAELANILSVIGTVLQTTVPFCFLAVLGGVINACSATPECPHWEVNFENNDKSLFGTMELDLSFLELEGLHDAWINLITILFVMGLIVLTFEVFKVFGALT